MPEHKDGTDYHQPLHRTTQQGLFCMTQTTISIDTISLNFSPFKLVVLAFFHALEAQCIKYIVQKPVNSADKLYSTFLSPFFYSSSILTCLVRIASKKLVFQNRKMYHCFQQLQ